MNSHTNIPHQKTPISTFAAMKIARRWLLWRSAPQLKNDQPVLDCDGKPKYTKIPYYVNGKKRFGTLDTELDISQFASYEQAVLELNRDINLYSGLAFALGMDGHGGFWQGVDLDDVRACGNESIAHEIQGYVEDSPSGKGCHAIGYGDWFQCLGSNSSGIEAYSEKRFFTVTEEVIREGPLVCLGSYIDAVLKPRHQRNKKHSTQPHTKNNVCQHLTESSCSSVNVATNIAPYIVTDLRSALTAMRSDDRDLWIKVGMALSCLGEQGRGLWLDWSARSEKHNPQEDARTWDSFKPNNISYQTVFHLAQAQGWVNPSSNSANEKIEPKSKKISVDISEPTFDKIEYLDDPYIPRGYAIGFFGRGESSKSTFIATLVAENSERYSTLWITSEESPEHVKIRHARSGGDVGSLAVFASEFSIYDDLEAAILDAKAKLDKPLGFVVLDAIVALVVWGQGENPNDDSSVKRLLRFINELAQIHNVSILFIGHTNKGNGHVVLADAVNGSTAWTNSVRLAYMLEALEGLDFVCSIRVVKSNLTQKFLQIFKTVPVFFMEANIDGVQPVLCKVEMDNERIYGVKAIELHLDATGDVSKSEKKRLEKIAEQIQSVMNVLSSGRVMSRLDIEEAIAPQEIIPRDWLALDPVLDEQGVTITVGYRNKRSYQIVECLHAE